jgi:hypothetical protein
MHDPMTMTDQRGHVNFRGPAAETAQFLAVVSGESFVPQSAMAKWLAEGIRHECNVAARSQIQDRLGSVNCPAVAFARIQPVVVDGGSSEDRPNGALWRGVRTQFESLHLAATQ